MTPGSQQATADVAERTRVLVVDDESNITDLVATVLRYEGFEVQTAATGRDALKAVTAFRPALVSRSDLRMILSRFGRVSRMRLNIATCWPASGVIAMPAISGWSSDCVST